MGGGARLLPDTCGEDCSLQVNFGCIDRRNVVASVCGHQGVLQPPWSRPPGIPTLFIPARPSRLLPTSIHQLPGGAAIEPVEPAPLVGGKRTYELGPARNVSAGKCSDCVKRLIKAAARYLKNNPVG
jgi:hypothetical protein